MKKTILYSAVLLCFHITACNKPNETKTQLTEAEPKQKYQMKSHVSLFEIPATDIPRAVDFYQNILDINIEKMEMPGMEMGIFPYEEQMVTGVIMKGEGYNPAADGVTIYLNGGDNLQIILDKVEKNGGQVLLPKTAHADNVGYFALFLDTEGNKLGLNSPN